MNRRRADLVSQRRKPKPKSELPAELTTAETDRIRREKYMEIIIGDKGNGEPAKRRALEIEATIRAARELSEIYAGDPCAAYLWIAASFLEELVSRDAEPAPAIKAQAPEPEAGTPMERFIAEMEAATDRALSAGLHPPNIGAVLRAEAERAEGGKA